MPVAKFPTDFLHLKPQLAEYGLSILGAVELLPSHCAEGEGGHAGSLGVLVGNAGSEMWPHFERSLEYKDGKTNPMNRWTRRVIANLVQDMSCDVRYPFDEPYWPFQRIARDAMKVESSPLGILIHPQYGLWHAFRAVIIVSPNNGLAAEVYALIHQVQKLNHPCDTCADKPCLSACPVSAFDGERLDVQSCFGHIDSSAEPDCMLIGCGARNACPVGQGHKYHNAQIEFHMKSYRGVS